MSQYLCIDCKEAVRPRQQALKCNGCGNWQHRTCGTGVSQQQYRSAVQNEADVEWCCTQCSFIMHTPVAESTGVEMMSFIQLTPAPDMWSRTTSGPEAASDPTAASGSEVASGSDFGSFEIPANMDEESMEDAIPASNIIPDDQPQPVRFEVVESSTQRGKWKLVDSSGFTYTLKRRYNDENAVWRCSVRNKTTSCSAIIRQRRMVYTPGLHMHCHQPLVGADIAVKVVRDVKEKAMQNYFQPAGVIVEQVSFSV